MAGATGGHPSIDPSADQYFLLALRSNAEGMTRPELTNDSLAEEPKLQKCPE